MGHLPREHQEPTHAKPDIRPVAQNAESAESWIREQMDKKIELEKELEAAENRAKIWNDEYHTACALAKRLAKQILPILKHMITDDGIPQPLYDDLKAAGITDSDILACLLKK